MIRRHLTIVTVLPLRPGGSKALILAGNLVLPCRIGKHGATVDKREGDGRSPRGKMRILGGFWRADRRLPPRTGLALRPVKPGDGWCDDPTHRNYNRLIRKPFSASHEDMMRADHQYDVVLDLDWNRTSRRRHRGSAIFLHVMNENRTGSAGCVTVPASKIDALLARLGPRTVIKVV